jgi:BlaI family transcriptional regulator, penicillinase repressor
MASPAQNSPRAATASSRRKSILDLAPLEVDCMNALWPLGEATVRDVQESLSGYRPRAYTTIMTILDRLAHKGIVARRKIGRAYLYSANLQPDVARDAAVDRLVAAFFGGSRQALAQHIGAATSKATRSDRVKEFVATPVAPARESAASEASAAAGEIKLGSLDETLL